LIAAVVIVQRFVDVFARNVLFGDIGWAMKRRLLKTILAKNDSGVSLSTPKRNAEIMQDTHLWSRHNGQKDIPPISSMMLLENSLYNIANPYSAHEEVEYIAKELASRFNVQDPQNHTDSQAKRQQKANKKLSFPPESEG
jgi:hypothetical protein